MQTQGRFDTCHQPALLPQSVTAAGVLSVLWMQALALVLSLQQRQSRAAPLVPIT
jgi:hypothetical protein